MSTADFSSPRFSGFHVNSPGSREVSLSGDLPREMGLDSRCPEFPRPWLGNYPSQVPANLSYPQEPLGWLLERAAERHGKRLACQYYDQRLSYEELLDQAQRLARVLQHAGLQPGDRVGVLLPNLPESLISYYGIWLAGGVVVSLSPLMVAEEVCSFLKATDCRVVITLDVLTPLICQSGSHPDLVLMTSMDDRLPRLQRLGYAWVRFRRLGWSLPCQRSKVMELSDALASAPHTFNAPKIDLDAPAYILPTGGTTGAPKAVTLSHRNLMANAWQLSAWSLREEGTDTFLAVIPFFHSYGLSTCVMMGTVLGASLILHHRFRPQSVVQLIEQHRPTVFLAVPAMMAVLNTQVLRHKAYNLKSIDIVISGGAPLPKKVAEEFESYCGCRVVEGYGLSEASPVTHVGPLDGTAISGSIGLPLPDTDARIVDQATGTETLPLGEVGELAVRGPQVMLGYWNQPEATKQIIRDGWLFTGDLATCDEKGFFRIVDRKKDLIITSGFNVYPADVEEVLRGHLAVQDAAVVGVPDEQRGEVVKAFITLRPGVKFDRKHFDHYLETKLAAHKRPKLVEICKEDLPRNFLGKVLRRQLREAKS